MSKRQVIYARLQTEAYVVGAGGLGTVFPSQNKTLENLLMYTDDNGLSISFSYRNMKKELLVPYANVILMELVPEETKKTSPVRVA